MAQCKDILLTTMWVCCVYRLQCIYVTKQVKSNTISNTHVVCLTLHVHVCTDRHHHQLHVVVLVLQCDLMLAAQAFKLDFEKMHTYTHM